MLICFLFFTLSVLFPSLTPSPPQKQNLSQRNGNYEKLIRINWSDLPSLGAICFGLIALYCVALIHLCNQVEYVSFDTNLTLFKKKSRSIAYCIVPLVSLVMLGLLVTEYPLEVILHFLPYYYSNIPSVMVGRKTGKLLTRTFYTLSCIIIFSQSVSPSENFLSILIFQLCSHSLTVNVPKWLSLILVILANDIEVNPGPHEKNCLTFMNWNLNSLVKGNFERVDLIEAHNSIFDYDLISVCETNLKDSTPLRDPLLNDYNFISANHPGNVAHGGVGLFYKSSLPVIHRQDLSFDECIVIELKFGRRKKIFFTVLYRSPSIKHDSPEFQIFLSNFRDLHTKIQAETPSATFFHW